VAAIGQYKTAERIVAVGFGERFKSAPRLLRLFAQVRALSRTKQRLAVEFTARLVGQVTVKMTLGLAKAVLLDERLAEVESSLVAIGMAGFLRQQRRELLRGCVPLLASV
jgi:hypothetical protein